MTSALLPWLHGLDLLGFAVWAGPLLCWLTVAPAGAGPGGVLTRRVQPAGAVVLLVTAGLATVVAFTDHDGLLGAAGLVRIGLLLGSLSLLADLLRTPVSGVRRGLGLVLVGVVALTLVLPTGVVRRPDWWLPTWAAGVSALGLAGWSGVLLTAVLGPLGEIRRRRLRLAGVLSAAVGMLGVGAAVAAAPGGSGSARTVAGLTLGCLVVALGCGLAGLRPQSDPRRSVQHSSGRRRSVPRRSDSRRSDPPWPGPSRWLGAGLAVTVGVLLLAAWPA